jgi:DNA-binding IclR family transcriptional regulator
MGTIDKMYRIFELLCANYKHGLTSKEISEELDIPLSSCFRILSTLKKYNFITQRNSDRHYFLGITHLRYADYMLAGLDVIEVSTPFLEKLHAETGQVVYFAQYRENLCVDMVVFGHIKTEASIARGQILPMYCTASGKVILAFLSDLERQAILKKEKYEKFTGYTITDRETINKELKEIYQTGVAYNIQQYNYGINAIATPIFDRSNRVIGSITIIGSSIDLDPYRMEELAEKCLACSREITTTLGGSFPDWFKVE